MAASRPYAGRTEQRLCRVSRSARSGGQLVTKQSFGIDGAGLCASQLAGQRHVAVAATPAICAQSPVGGGIAYDARSHELPELFPDDRLQ